MKVNELEQPILRRGAEAPAPLDIDVWVVVSPNGDLEVLDAPPRWDTAALGQRVYLAAINGGDSLEWIEAPVTCAHCGRRGFEAPHSDTCERDA